VLRRAVHVDATSRLSPLLFSRRRAHLSGRRNGRETPGYPPMARPRLKREHLEARDVPATFGTPWADGEHLTLSFAPDGTPINGVGSSLFASLGAYPQSWQTEILRAYQTWAVSADINIGVVADGG